MTLEGAFESTLAAAQAGAEWALADLYRDLHPAVLRYLKAQEPGEGDDLASEAWIDVARGLHRFRGDERDLRRWVFTIARRRLVDHRRRTTRRRTDPVPVESLSAVPDVRDAEGQALEAISAEEAVARVTAVLSPDQAEVVLLRVVAGLSAEEAGSVMGKRAGAIRVLQHRALERLAAYYREAAPVTGPPPKAM